MDTTRAVRVLAGYDGSLPSGMALEAAAMLLPSAHAWVTHFWTAPFSDEAIRRQLRNRVTGRDELIAAIEREGAAEAQHIAATGCTLARTAGWAPEPLTERVYGGIGFAIAERAEKTNADVVVVGSRGLGGARAVLGSVSDIVAHYTPRPVLVVPHPLLSDERTDLAAGPVLVGWDGSPGARQALTAAEALFAGRPAVLAAVTDDPVDAPAAHELVRLPVKHRHLTPGRAVAEALAAEAHRRHAAIIVVGSRGHHAPREILLGSTAMATLHHAHRPVLVVHHPTGHHER